MSLQLVSLFAGVGGFDIAAERAGIDPVVACEIDPQARGVLQHRLPNTTLINDVKDVTGERLTELGLDPRRTVITGGFPCQDLSVAGKQAGLEGGERSSLFFEIVRILREFNPQWFILENVPGLLSSKGGRDMGIVVGELAELGYSFSWRILDAQNFGVPQRRRRVFIVGHFGADETRVEQVLFEPEGSGRNLEAGQSQGQDVAGDPAPSVDSDSYRMLSFGEYEQDDTASALKARDYKDATDLVVPYVKSRRAQTDQDDETWVEGTVTPTLNRIDNTGESRATVLMIDGTRVGDVRVTEGQTMQTVISRWGTGGNNVPMIETNTPPTTVRRLTPMECERLQGFPDGWSAQRVDHKKGIVVDQADSSRYKQMGNAVAVPVVEWIFNRLVLSEETA
jgi:DNA (cytosine-5)-methyltransferase 1